MSTRGPACQMRACVQRECTPQREDMIAMIKTPRSMTWERHSCASWQIIRMQPLRKSWRMTYEVSLCCRMYLRTLWLDLLCCTGISFTYGKTSDVLFPPVCGIDKQRGSRIASSKELRNINALGPSRTWHHHVQTSLSFDKNAVPLSYVGWHGRLVAGLHGGPVDSSEARRKYRIPCLISSRPGTSSHRTKKKNSTDKATSTIAHS